MSDIQLVFIVLKWVGAVDWSWGVVLIPLWIELATSAIAALWAWWSCLDL